MDFDVVVIGSGAGGGTAAYAMASRGLRVLVVEKGRQVENASLFQDEKAMLIDRIAHGNQLLINGREKRLFTSGIPGGGTSLYGAVLLRPSLADFQPGRFYTAYLPHDIWDWPIDYHAMEPYYQKAEDLYGVSGDHEAEYPHIGSRSLPYAQSCQPLEPINRHLNSTLTSQGLHPFHLPLGIDFKTCRHCPTCPGYICPNEARASSLNRCLKPAVETMGAEFWTGWEAERLTKGTSHKIVNVEIRNTSTGEHRFITADCFMLGAGAIETPLLLLKSGLEGNSDQVGRNYMYHAGVLTAGVFLRPVGGEARFIKQLGWTDYYLGTEEFKHKLGYVQMLPVPGPLTLNQQSPVPLPIWLAKSIYRRTIAFAATVEDLPQPSNRVQIARNGRASLTHTFHDYDKFRSRYLKKRLTSVMKKCGAGFVMAKSGDHDDLHTAHQVGTCRFGSNPVTSALDENCRLRNIDNLYVVDGSFMPTSLGVGPALTIIANALRVCDNITRNKS